MGNSGKILKTLQLSTIVILIIELLLLIFGHSLFGYCSFYTISLCLIVILALKTSLRINTGIWKGLLKLLMYAVLACVLILNFVFKKDMVLFENDEYRLQRSFNSINEVHALPTLWKKEGLTEESLVLDYPTNYEFWFDTRKKVIENVEIKELNDSTIVKFELKSGYKNYLVGFLGE